MTYKKTEKEIIKAIVKYGEKTSTLADVINQSRLFEKRGFAIVCKDGNNIIYLRNDKYGMESELIVLGYITEFLSLVDTLIQQRHLIMIPCQQSNTIVYGAEQNNWKEMDILFVNKNERISFEFPKGWFNAKGEQIRYPIYYTDNEMNIGNKFNLAFAVSQDLKDLVKNNFKSEEQIRFEKQQFATWVSIGVALLIGLLGIFVNR